jgi:hypothetical protein
VASLHDLVVSRYAAELLPQNQHRRRAWLLLVALESFPGVDGSAQYQARGMLKAAHLAAIAKIQPLWDCAVQLGESRLLTLTDPLVPDASTQIATVLSAAQRATLFDRVAEPLTGAIAQAVDDVRQAWLGYRAQLYGG